ncbi:MAG: hypothetical protein CL424_03240 [Acidimicrobiaceae bacterium]|nr:hypothetical protein [Acidimicrobiaceae bacterium]
MTNPATILIAVDADEGAKRATLAAASLFPDARFRFAHVARPVPLTPPGAYGPAGVAPVGVAAVDDLDPAKTKESARAVAAQAANDCGRPDATAVGLIGEPADALIEEAVSCGAVAIVVSAHDRGWVERLFHHSVRDDIERLSPIPVVVAPDPS